MSEHKIQSVIFEAASWTVDEARKWLDDHDFKSDKVDTQTDDDDEPVRHRFRQFDPDACDAESFTTLTEDFPDGVSAAMCVTEDEASAGGRDLELRTFPMELRVTGDDDAPVLEGHIAVFNKLGEDFGGYREKIAPGAFTESIKKDDIRALWNHESGLVLGRLSAKTLSLEEDDIGLAFRNTPPDTTWFRDRMVSLKRGDVTGASFGFWTEKDEWHTEKDGTTIRTLIKLNLQEVSPGVTFPAYPQTDVALRSMRRWLVATARPAPAARQLPAGVVDIDLRRRRLRLHELAP